MAKNSPKPEETGKARAGRKTVWPILGAIALVVILAVAMAVANRDTSPETDQNLDHSDSSFGTSSAEANVPEESALEAEGALEASARQPEEQPDPGLPFPYSVDGLEVKSLFSSDIMNPDGGFEMGTQLASLELTNTSGQYLVSARIHVTLTDGTEYLFQVQDLPDGGSVLAFSPDNALYDGAVPCASISAETEYTGGGQLMEESLSVSVDGTAVTLTNLTDQDMEPVTVICHETVDESGFFGGTSYSYETETIPAGGSVTVEAIDCMIGIPAVVRITPVS